MTILNESQSGIDMPKLPSRSVKDFIPYISEHPKTPIAELLKPYKAYESKLRKLYAQTPDHAAIKDGNVNLVPIFDGHEAELKIRARDLGSETEEEASKFIMALKDKDRKATGSPAVVGSFKDFQQNFNLFSESSLVDLNWSNVVAAGSAVTTALLPVPEKWATSKRHLREYYHEHLAPASDVDLFIYGLNEEEALAKILQIERNIKDSILHETTTIRTKNAITIASQYPTRHIQIVLRLYDSISQIIAGFDVDCACAAYTGDQVYAAPRAVAAFITQCNTIDLTRRSPSYENRLSKYSHRGFEVQWALLDRSRIDPTIFERSFGRTQGLARLLILEKLPKTADREQYMDQRRTERGRPQIYRGHRHGYGISGNIKEREEDEVAEWVAEEEVASYHTMTVPYGPKYHAARINKLLYAKDLLQNAEWNLPKDRDVYLHRHPCFFGTAEEIFQDCCGYCPVPKTDDEVKIADDEKKTNVSGPLQFLMDDPGRQEIGSFNPITDDEWTTMAYVGDTARLCQAIVDGDLEHVQDWCAQEGVDVNRRDYTGRTPLHLAVMASTLEVVDCLINNGARLIARLVDGRTALHIAAARGNTEIVKVLMNKSLANEEEEDEKEDARRAARKAECTSSGDVVMAEKEEDLDSDDDSIDIGSEDIKSEDDSMTMGSFVKVDKAKEKADDGVPDDSVDDPDIYDINVISWDYGLSPLHLAILNGHLDTIELLISEYGADVLLPVKFVEPGTSNARGAIMTIILAMALPTEKAKEVVKLLLKLGATSTQADMDLFTAFHHVVAEDNAEILDVLLENDRPASLSILNHLGMSGRWGDDLDSPLTTSTKKGHKEMALKLLNLGAKPEVSFDDWIKVYLAKNTYAKRRTAEENLKQYQGSVMQPIIAAAVNDMTTTVQDLINNGADPSTLEKNAWGIINHNAIGQVGESLLDIIQRKLKLLRKYKVESENNTSKEPFTLNDESWYTQGLQNGTYEYWTASQDYQMAKRANKKKWQKYEKTLKMHTVDGYQEKQEAIDNLIQELQELEKFLIKSGAKTFNQLKPDLPDQPENQRPWFNYEPPKPEPYKTEFRFQVPDLNPTKKDGYQKLFAAAWNNDLETVKSFTLAPWESSVSKPLIPPLMIAVRDGNGFSPFSIAVLRGHRELAQKIFQICIAQYHQEDGSHKQRWNTQPSDSDDEGYSDSDNNDALPIYSELISDKYTVDNLGAVSNVVKSDVLPLTMLEWPAYTGRFIDSETSNEDQQSLLSHAIGMDDMNLFKFIMKLGAEQQALLAEEEDDQKCYTITRDTFYKAIKLGRTAMLAEMIRLTGVGIPLNELIKTSGVELKTKPRYYQGLSVGGKKRADWAQAPGGNVKIVEERIPPLLQAAHVGNVESVEWFMSDAPMRRYKEFAEGNKHDKRIKTLQETGNGFDKTIGTWLYAKSELALHCAILYNPDKESDIPNYLFLIKHLISISPDSIEQKSSEGWTPLQLALSTQREDVVSYLISLGANQRHRDKKGRNMIHTMVATPYGNARSDAKQLGVLISLFDKPSITEMLLERCNTKPGALTPLALWMAGSGRYYHKTDFLRILTRYSSGEDLEMINGEGDLPLHVAIKNCLTTIASFLISLNPSLLYRENATGRTPFEMSRDMHLASCVSKPPNMQTNFNYYPSHDIYNSLTSQPVSSFAPPKPKDEDEEEVGEQSPKATYEVCIAADGEMGDEQRKRRLVSLFEANEVAKRLAGQKRFERGLVVNGGLVDEGKPDVVSEWMGSL